VAGGTGNVAELARRHPECPADRERRCYAAHRATRAFARGTIPKAGRMKILLLLIPLSLAFLAGAIWLFFWAVNNGQFDDLDTPGLLPLDDAPRHKEPPP
jgi:cbb3-type cytochrome oxidase maturation protein